MVNRFSCNTNTGEEHRHRCEGCPPRTCGNCGVALRRNSVRGSRNKATRWPWEVKLFSCPGLLEKVINFLEGWADLVIYCLNQDSFKSERGTNWIGHWGSRRTVGLSQFCSPPRSPSGHCSPGWWGCTVLFNAFRTLSIWSLPGCDVLVSSVYAKTGSAFLLPICTRLLLQWGSDKVSFL